MKTTLRNFEKAKIPIFNKRFFFPLFETLLKDEVDERKSRRGRGVSQEKIDDGEGKNIWERLGKKIFEENRNYLIRDSPASELEISYLRQKCKLVLNKLIAYASTEGYYLGDVIDYYLNHCQLMIKLKNISHLACITSYFGQSNVKKEGNERREKDPFYINKILTGKTKRSQFLNYIKSDQYKKGDFVESFSFANSIQEFMNGDIPKPSRNYKLIRPKISINKKRRSIVLPKATIRRQEEIKLATISQQKSYCLSGKSSISKRKTNKKGYEIEFFSESISTKNSLNSRMVSTPKTINTPSKISSFKCSNRFISPVVVKKNPTLVPTGRRSVNFLKKKDFFF